jgi:hypothetical protein
MNSSSQPSPVVVYVDVDDTLVRSAGGKRIRVPAVIEHVRVLHAQGAALYCWSAGGADYARRTAEEFGIAGCFMDFLPKPHIMIDDQNVAEWPQTVAVHPSSCGGRSLDYYRGLLAKH